MRVIVTFKGLSSSDSLKEHAEKKIGKLAKFFNEETIANVMFKIRKKDQISEITISQNNMVFRAEVATEDMYSSIDRAVQIIERQIRKNRTKLEKNLHKEALRDLIDSEIEIESYDIVRTKKVPLKPMGNEEAALQLDLLGHEFYVYENADTGLVNVIYKRKDGGYGVIEPE